VSEEVRVKVKDVEARCAAIHRAAKAAGITLDHVSISEERSVRLCSHSGHAPDVANRWRVEMQACHSTDHATCVKVSASRPSSSTLDGVTVQAISLFVELSPAMAVTPLPTDEQCALGDVDPADFEAEALEAAAEIAAGEADAAEEARADARRAGG